MCYQQQIRRLEIVIKGEFVYPQEALLLASRCNCAQQETWWVDGDCFVAGPYQGYHDDMMFFLYRTPEGRYFTVAVREEGGRPVFYAHFVDDAEARWLYESYQLKWASYDEAFPSQKGTIERLF